MHDIEELARDIDSGFAGMEDPCGGFAERETHRRPEMAKRRKKTKARKHILAEFVSDGIEDEKKLGMASDGDGYSVTVSGSIDTKSDDFEKSELMRRLTSSVRKWADDSGYDIDIEVEK